MRKTKIGWPPLNVFLNFYYIYTNFKNIFKSLLEGTRGANNYSTDQIYNHLQLTNMSNYEHTHHLQLFWVSFIELIILLRFCWIWCMMYRDLFTQVIVPYSYIWRNIQWMAMSDSYSVAIVYYIQWYLERLHYISQSNLRFVLNINCW